MWFLELVVLGRVDIKLTDLVDSWVFLMEGRFHQIRTAATCRYYGISRQAYYHWLKRYEDESVQGLRDRSSTPHHSPTATNAEVVEKTGRDLVLGLQ